MTAWTSVTMVVSQPAPAGGNGLHWAMGTATGTGSYDTNGSVIDMSDIFKTACYSMELYVDDADIRLTFVPKATTYATATGLVFKDDNAGTEATAADDLSTTCGTTHWIAYGTDI
jgi:hypothetical protein